jgi:hypothetical protein
VPATTSSKAANGSYSWASDVVMAKLPSPNGRSVTLVSG